MRISRLSSAGLVRQLGLALLALPVLAHANADVEKNIANRRIQHKRRCMTKLLGRRRRGGPAAPDCLCLTQRGGSASLLRQQGRRRRCVRFGDVQLRGA